MCDTSLTNFKGGVTKWRIKTIPLLAKYITKYLWLSRVFNLFHLFFKKNKSISKICRGTPIKSIYHKLFIVKQSDTSNDQMSNVDDKNCQMFLAHKQLNTTNTIDIKGTANTKQSQILGIVGAKSNKNTKTVVAISQTRPADSKVINKCLFVFLNVVGVFCEIKSFKVILKISHIFCSVTISGRESPFSHFETDLSEKLSFSASSCCVRFASFLFLAIFWAIIDFRFSISIK